MEEATELMLKLWHSNTNKSYNSLFNKWSRWCSEQGSDSFPGSIGEVVNFLAYLLTKDYQERTGVHLKLYALAKKSKRGTPFQGFFSQEMPSYAGIKRL